MHKNYRRKSYPPVRASWRAPWENQSKHGMKQAAWVWWRARQRLVVARALRLPPEEAGAELDQLPPRMLRDIRFYGF